jgi:hypothetical protein
MSKVNMANSQSALQGLSKFQAFEKSKNVFKPSGFVIFDAGKDKVRRVGFFESLFTSNAKLEANHQKAKAYLVKKLSTELINNINLPPGKNLEPYSAIKGGLDNASEKLVNELTKNNKIEKRDEIEKIFAKALDKHMTAENIHSDVKGEEKEINTLLKSSTNNLKTLSDGAVSNKTENRLFNMLHQLLPDDQKTELSPGLRANMRGIAKDAAWIKSQTNISSHNALVYAQIMNNEIIVNNPNFKNLPQEAKFKIALKVIDAVNVHEKLKRQSAKSVQTEYGADILLFKKEKINQFAMEKYQNELVNWLKENPENSSEIPKENFKKWAINMSNPDLEQLNNAGKIYVLKQLAILIESSPYRQEFINEALKLEKYKTDPESQKKYEGLTEIFKNQAKLAIDKEIKLREVTNSSPMTDDEKIAIIDQYRELMTQSISLNDANNVERPDAFEY